MSPVLAPVSASLCELKGIAERLDTWRYQRGLPPTVPRTPVLKQLANLMAGSRTAIALTGERGSGRRTIVDQLAWFLRNRPAELPPALRDFGLVRIPARTWIAGCQYVGSPERRMGLIVEALERNRAALFLDDLLPLVSQGRLDPADPNSILRTLMAEVRRGRVKLVTTMTPEEHRTLIRSQPWVDQALHPVRVDPVDAETTARWLETVRSRLAGRHKLHIPGDTIACAMALATLHLRGLAWPGKAFELVQRALTLASADRQTRTLEPRHVQTALCRWTGLRPALVVDGCGLRRRDLESKLAARVFGQPEAVAAIADVVLRLKAGLADPKRPPAVLLFAGPTGVGKTHAAKVLAETVFSGPDRLIRVDMADLADGGPGLAGFLDRLAESARATPNAVLLLDEFEKAAPEVRNVFLPVLDEGKLADPSGRVTDLSAMVMVLTTNLGSEIWQRETMGFGGAVAPRADLESLRQRLEDELPPELLGRITGILAFRPLDPRALAAIALAEVKSLGKRAGLAGRGLVLEPTRRLLRAVIQQGHDPRRGARPMRDAVDRLVAIPTAEFLAEGKAIAPGILRVDIDPATGNVRVTRAPGETAGTDTSRQYENRVGRKPGSTGSVVTCSPGDWPDGPLFSGDASHPGRRTCPSSS